MLSSVVTDEDANSIETCFDFKCLQIKYSDATLVIDEQTPSTAHKILNALPVIQQQPLVTTI